MLLWVLILSLSSESTTWTSNLTKKPSRISTNPNIGKVGKKSKALLKTFIYNNHIYTEFGESQQKNPSKSTIWNGKAGIHSFLKVREAEVNLIFIKRCIKYSSDGITIIKREYKQNKLVAYKLPVLNLILNSLSTPNEIRVSPI